MEIHGPAEALHARHHAGLAACEPLAPRLAPIRASERAHEHLQHGAAEPMIVGEPIAQRVRDRQDPLSDRDIGRQDLVDQVRRPFDHPPSAAAWTHRATLARKRHEGSNAQSPQRTRAKLRQHAAAEELSELAHDERGEPRPVGPVADVGGEVAPVPADDAVEHTRRR
jgi:hypothetical protein